MSQVFILDSTTVTGTNVLAEARAAISKLAPLNVRIPKMEVKGDWVMNGFDFSFEDWQPAFLPLGNKYVRAGERKAQVEPTEHSELRVFFVFSGEGIRANDPLATENMLEPVEDVEQEEEAEAEATE